MAFPSCSSSFTYDVFLSFRGSDTRLGFTGYLYKALCDRGIYTFIDDEELQRGEEITPALVKAIQESRIAITVLSEDYASSSLCLDELATILHCAQNKGMLVIPVFYNMDPSDVRHHKGSYGEALARHEKRFKAKKEKLQKWKMALHQVANFSGYHFKDGYAYEYKFIGSIVEQVSREINRAPLHVVDYPVGLEDQVLQVRKLLDVGSDDVVHIIGIHGMGGLGKSTLARAVYNLIAVHFDESCFLQNVREESNKHGLKHLQSILLSKLLGEKKIKLTSEQEGASMIQQRLQRKKVLLILDDVDNCKQLQAFVGRPDWFGLGSRVIITTRDKQLLKSHEVERTYEVKELSENDALQLLTWNAFKKEKVDPRYVEVLNRVVTYASGLPLALEVIGSSLFGKSIEDWESAINQYEKIPKKEILEILKVSFDALEEEEKSVFLDIACCFKGCKLTEVEDIPCAHYGHSVKHHIGVLVEKSLIKRSEGKVTLHDLIEDMGKEIVRQQSPKQPGKWSRLWSHEDIRKVLEDNMGTSEIKMICLDFPLFEEEIDWDGNAFKEMTNLKTLVIRNGEFSKGPDYFPESLRVLEWHRYPSKCFPSNFNPKELCICKLPDSCFTSFVSDGLSKKFRNLIVLNLDKCKLLTQIPDVSDLVDLKELSFKECENLTKVHDSVGILAKLKKLSAEGCRKLRSFPSLNLTSLETLELSKCSSLEYFPEILGEMENIWELHLYCTPIKELPFSFENFIGLQRLYLSDCGIVQLQISIAMMPELSVFDIRRCNRWQWIKSEEGEEKFGSLVSSKTFSAIDCNLYDDFFSTGFTMFAHVDRLDLSRNNFTILPEWFKELQFLRHLDVSGCKHLREIRGVPPNLEVFKATNCISLSSSSSSKFLNQELHEAQGTRFLLQGTSIPEWFDHLSRGPSISFWFRNKFPAKVLCLLIAPVHACVKPMVFINGKVQNFSYYSSDMPAGMLDMDHTYLFDLQACDFDNNLFEKAWEKEWNHVEIRYDGVLAYEKEKREEGVLELESSLIKATGIHIFKQEKATMEDDIRFNDPYTNTKVDEDLNSLESQTHLLKSVVLMDVPLSSFNNDVFLCYRREDTRYSFTGNLCRALRDSEIHTFIDDEELQRGDEITLALKKAIEDSRFFIVVLSQNYASSSFCLNVLAYILECVKRKGLLVLPVFYKVDPSNVGHHRGSFGEALANHEKKFKAKMEGLEHNMEKLEKWKMALHETANFPGYHFKQGDGYEYEFITRIVELVSSKINRAPLHVADYSVGIESYSDAFSFDVFLSCRGSDTLHGFTGYLYKALHDNGIHTFVDEELQRGEEITPAIVKAIEESRIAITVLSINYASSSFCLDELATILDCLKRKRLLVLPVFYNLDPSQVGLQKDSYGEALAKHEERFKHNMEKLEKWKMALHQVANLSGFHVKHGAGYEYEFIGKIVEWVSSKINPAHYPVGLGSKVLEVRKLLDVGCDDGVHMLGIHGIDGVGKSTLAREVYNNLIADHYDASCFIENVREKSKKHGLQHLQSILLSQILGQKDINLTSVQQGISMMQRGRLQQKTVLLVLDDVDRPEQLQAVVGKPAWFGPGSRVIITTQDKQLLTSHDVKRTYEVKELNKDDALQLLKWKAFKMHYFDPRYEELLNRAVTYASSLPLALEILGSNLFGKSVKEWKSTIHQFERSPNNPIQMILKASFDSLEEKERSVFLDIACCFKGYELAEVQDILHAHYGHCMKYYIDILVDKSLVKLSRGTKPCYDTITMHDLIAKEIVQQESLTKPGERRRLWLLEDVREVLGYNTGTSKTEIICLDFPIFDEEEIVEWDGKAFQNMQNLKTLIIRNVNFSKGPEYLPNSLRVLEWWRYPSHCLPSDFHPKELAICKLPGNCISPTELTNLLKKFVNLRILNFSSANV